MTRRTVSEGASQRQGGATAGRRGLIAGLAVVGAALALAFLALLGRTGAGPLPPTGAPGALRPAAARVWVVRPGDTLWSIAEAVDPNADVRPLVDRLDSEVGGAALYPGERVAIP